RGIGAPSGLFLYRSSIDFSLECDFIRLEDTSPTKPPVGTLTFVNFPNRRRIWQSCNGLLCCFTFGGPDAKCNYHIYNPTIHRFTTLPNPAGRVFRNSRRVGSVHAVNLAFDPLKLPHYKAVCVYDSQILPEQFEIEVYSSETGLWRHSADPFSAKVNFELGVFWNCAINWVSYQGNSLYFNVDEERLGTMPMPPLPYGCEGRKLRYFAESCDHLHLIESYGPPTTQFNVYEMAKDYSGWSVKYLVDLDPVMDAFPESIVGLLDYKFLIISFLRRNSDEESFLVLGIPGKAIRYNFSDKTFKKLCDVPRDHLNFELDHAPMFGWYNAFQYIESLSCVTIRDSSMHFTVESKDDKIYTTVLID
ncbi:unnamed protein product, partial [Ilex paraguariensis]